MATCRPAFHRRRHVQRSEAGVVLLGGGDPAALANIEHSFAGKIIVDCGNPSDESALQREPSRTGALAQGHPCSSIVNAFNAISAETLAFVAKRGAPEIGGVHLTGFYCGDDDQAKRVVASLISELSLDPIDCGPLTNAALLESLSLLEAYLQAHVFDLVFAITVARPPTDRSSIDAVF